MKRFDEMGTNINVEIGPFRIEDVATKIGTLFGEKGREVGEKIDSWTKDVTIKFPTRK
ncbi:MAG: hypothetical protein WBL93_10480 [Lutisporaceae bacterium]